MVSAEESEYNAQTIDVSNWTPRDPPARASLEGRFVRLEPLDITKHGDALYDLVSKPEEEQRFRWLPDLAPKSREEFQVGSGFIGLLYKYFRFF